MIKDYEINSSIIADYFLTKSELTPKKIQKLVYYAYSWFIALNNQNENQIDNVLFNEVPDQACLIIIGFRVCQSVDSRTSFPYIIYKI